jgi:hypothetical protein
VVSQVFGWCVWPPSNLTTVSPSVGHAALSSPLASRAAPTASSTPIPHSTNTQEENSDDFVGWPPETQKSNPACGVVPTPASPKNASVTPVHNMSLRLVGKSLPAVSTTSSAVGNSQTDPGLPTGPPVIETTNNRSDKLVEVALSAGGSANPSVGSDEKEGSSPKRTSSNHNPDVGIGGGDGVSPTRTLRSPKPIVDSETEKDDEPRRAPRSLEPNVEIGKQ